MRKRVHLIPFVRMEGGQHYVRYIAIFQRDEHDHDVAAQVIPAETKPFSRCLNTPQCSCGHDTRERAWLCSCSGTVKQGMFHKSALCPISNRSSTGASVDFGRSVTVALNQLTLSYPCVWEVCPALWASAANLGK